LKLYVYITNWVKPSTNLTKIKDEFYSLVRNTTEFVKGTGVPTFIDPILLILKNLGEIKEYEIQVKIISNEDIGIDFKDFSRTLDNKLLEIQNIVYDVSLLNNPFELSKKYIDFFEKDVQNSECNDIFVYLEHDQLFTQSNLDYFKLYAGFLDQYNLRPGYIRIEWNKSQKRWHTTDSTNKSINFADNLKGLAFDSDLFFLTLDNPYFGFSVHSSSSAKRFFEYRSDYSTLLNLTRWGMTEISAMTDLLNTSSSSMARELQFTSIAPIAFDRSKKQIDSGALAWHLSNRYANTSSIFRYFRGFGNQSLVDLNEYIFKNYKY
jgi:hypothetical protein